MYLVFYYKMHVYQVPGDCPLLVAYLVFRWEKVSWLNLGFNPKKSI